MATETSGRIGGSAFASESHASSAVFATIPLPLHLGQGTDLGGAGGGNTPAVLSLPPSLARRFAASISRFRCARSFFDGLAHTEPSPRQRTQAVAGTMLSQGI